MERGGNKVTRKDEEMRREEGLWRGSGEEHFYLSLMIEGRELGGREKNRGHNKWRKREKVAG